MCRNWKNKYYDCITVSVRAFVCEYVSVNVNILLNVCQFVSVCMDECE